MHQQRNTSCAMKRKALCDITNTTDSQVPEPVKSDHVSMFLPIIHEKSIDTCTSEGPEDGAGVLEREYQNAHPLLPWYNDDLVDGYMAYSELQKMLRPENHKMSLNF